MREPFLYWKIYLVLPNVHYHGSTSEMIYCVPALLCLQDYLVLLPSAYYEAPILQIRVTEPCTYSSGSDASKKYEYEYICRSDQLSLHRCKSEYSDLLNRTSCL